jgi:hypothetical protein
VNLLTDRSMEIPPFLLRTADGGFAYPGIAVPITAAVMSEPTVDPMAEAMAAADRRDNAVRAALVHAETATSKERHLEQAAARKAQKASEAERLLKNKLKQREVFVQHFKWDHEK